MKTIRTAVLSMSMLLLLWSTAMSHPTTASADNTDAEAGYRLLIYYGSPKGVNQVWDEHKAAEILAAYDVLVFGEGLEEPGHRQYRSTKTIFRLIHERNQAARLFGYIDLAVSTGHSAETLKTKARQWKKLGADGIFLDCAGFDYDVSRARLNEIVRYIHTLDMPVFVNAWNPDDVLGSAVHPEWNPTGEPTALDSRDIYLFENFLLATDITTSGSPSTFRSSFREKIDKALRYREQLGIRLMSVSEVDYATYSKQAVRKFFRMNEVAAGVFSLDAYGVAPEEYSGSGPTADVVRFFPYINNFRDYHTTNVSYLSKHEDQDFSRAGFRLHSLTGEHYYNFPADTQFAE